VNGDLAATQVHWSPHRPERAEVNGVTLTEGDVADADALAASLLGPVNINTSVRCGSLSHTSAPVFLIAGLRDTHALALNAAGANLIVNTWTWARQLHLASPASRVENVFAGCSPGQAMAITLTGRLQNLVVARDGQVLPTATPGLGSGWAFVFHADLLPRWLEVAATWLWLALMGAPLGFWTRRTTLSAAAILLVAGGSLAAPYFLDTRNLSVHEMGALLGGVVGGLVVRRLRTGGAMPPSAPAE
jgi:hypothetical protein